MLKTQRFGGIFLLGDKSSFYVFKQHEIFGPKKRNSMSFPWPQPFSLKSMTFPGLENAFSNSMTFHDFSWLYEPCYTASNSRQVLLKLNLYILKTDSGLAVITTCTRLKKAYSVVVLLLQDCKQKSQMCILRSAFQTTLLSTGSSRSTEYPV